MMASSSYEGVFREFFNFCELSLSGEDPKFLELIKNRYKECDEEFRQSESMEKLLKETWDKMDSERSRLFVHLKHFLTLLKGKRKRKKGAHGRKKEKDGRIKFHSEDIIKKCFVVLENIDHMIPDLCMSEILNSPTRLRRRPVEQKCIVTDGHLKYSNKILIADEAQLEMLSLELAGTVRSEIKSERRNSLSHSSCASSGSCSDVAEDDDDDYSIDISRAYLVRGRYAKKYCERESSPSSQDTVELDNHTVHANPCHISGNHWQLSPTPKKAIRNMKSVIIEECHGADSIILPFYSVDKLSLEDNKRRFRQAHTDNESDNLEFKGQRCKLKYEPDDDLEFKCQRVDLKYERDVEDSGVGGKEREAIGYDDNSIHFGLHAGQSSLEGRLNFPCVKRIKELKPVSTNKCNRAGSTVFPSGSSEKCEFNNKCNVQIENVANDHDSIETACRPVEKKVSVTDDKKMSTPCYSVLTKDHKSCESFLFGTESFEKSVDHPRLHWELIPHTDVQEANNDACENSCEEQEPEVKISNDLDLIAKGSPSESHATAEKDMDDAESIIIHSSEANACVDESLNSDESDTPQYPIAIDNITQTKTLTASPSTFNDVEQKEESYSSSTPPPPNAILTNCNKHKADEIIEEISPPKDILILSEEENDDKDPALKVKDIISDSVAAVMQSVKLDECGGITGKARRVPFVSLTKVGDDQSQSKSSFMNFLSLQSKDDADDARTSGDSKKEMGRGSSLKLKTKSKRPDSKFKPSTTKAGVSSPTHDALSEDEFDLGSKPPSTSTDKSPPPDSGVKEDRYVKRLEDCLTKLRNEIERCQHKELSLDDLDAMDSNYIYEDLLKKKFVKCWAKLCKLTKRTVTTGRPTERTIYYEGTRYKEINRRLEKFLNKHKIFPDFHDVKAIVKYTDKKYKLNLNPNKIDGIAREAFVDIGNMLQKRRHEDFIATFRSGSGTSDCLTEGPDPALFDPILRQKLDSNRKVAKSNLDHVIEKFTKLQNAKADGDGSSTDDDDEDDVKEAEEERLSAKVLARKTKSLVEVEEKEDAAPPSAKKKKRMILESDDEEDEIVNGEEDVGKEDDRVREENDEELMEEDESDLSHFHIEVDIACEETEDIFDHQFDDADKSHNSVDRQQPGETNGNDCETTRKSGLNDGEYDIKSNVIFDKRLQSILDNEILAGDSDSVICSSDRDSDKEEDDSSDDVQIIVSDSDSNDDGAESARQVSPMSISSYDEVDDDDSGGFEDKDDDDEDRQEAALKDDDEKIKHSNEMEIVSDVDNVDDDLKSKLPSSSKDSLDPALEEEGLSCQAAGLRNEDSKENEQLGSSLRNKLSVTAMSDVLCEGNNKSVSVPDGLDKDSNMLKSDSVIVVSLTSENKHDEDSKKTEGAPNLESNPIEKQRTSSPKAKLNPCISTDPKKLNLVEVDDSEGSALNDKEIDRLPCKISAVSKVRDTFVEQNGKSLASFGDESQNSQCPILVDDELDEENATIDRKEFQGPEVAVESPVSKDEGIDHLQCKKSTLSKERQDHPFAKLAGVGDGKSHAFGGGSENAECPILVDDEEVDEENATSVSPKYKELHGMEVDKEKSVSEDKKDERQSTTTFGKKRELLAKLDGKSCVFNDESENSPILVDDEKDDDDENVATADLDSSSKTHPTKGVEEADSSICIIMDVRTDEDSFSWNNARPQVRKSIPSLCIDAEISSSTKPTAASSKSLPETTKKGGSSVFAVVESSVKGKNHSATESCKTSKTSSPGKSTSDCPVVDASQCPLPTTTTPPKDLSKSPKGAVEPSTDAINSQNGISGQTKNKTSNQCVNAESNTSPSSSKGTGKSSPDKEVDKRTPEKIGKAGDADVKETEISSPDREVTESNNGKKGKTGEEDRVESSSCADSVIIEEGKLIEKTSKSSRASPSSDPSPPKHTPTTTFTITDDEMEEGDDNSSATKKEKVVSSPKHAPTTVTITDDEMEEGDADSATAKDIDGEVANEKDGDESTEHSIPEHNDDTPDPGTTTTTDTVTHLAVLLSPSQNNLGKTTENINEKSSDVEDNVNAEEPRGSDDGGSVGGDDGEQEDGKKDKDGQLINSSERGKKADKSNSNEHRDLENKTSGIENSIETDADNKTTGDGEEDDVFSSITKLCEIINSSQTQEQSSEVSEEEKDTVADDSKKGTEPEKEDGLDEGSASPGTLAGTVPNCASESTKDNAVDTVEKSMLLEDKRKRSTSDDDNDDDTLKDSTSFIIPGGSDELEDLSPSKILASKEEARDAVGKQLAEVSLLVCERVKSSQNQSSSGTGRQSAKKKSDDDDDDDLEIVYVDMPPVRTVRRGRPLKSSSYHLNGNSIPPRLPEVNGFPYPGNPHPARGRPLKRLSSSYSSPQTSRVKYGHPSAVPPSGSHPSYAVASSSSHQQGKPSTATSSQLPVNWNLIKASIAPELQTVRQPTNPAPKPAHTQRFRPYAGNQAPPSPRFRSHRSQNQSGSSHMNTMSYPVRNSRPHSGKISSQSMTLGPRVPIPSLRGLHNNAPDSFPISPSRAPNRFGHHNKMSFHSPSRPASHKFPSAHYIRQGPDLSSMNANRIGQLSKISHHSPSRGASYRSSSSVHLSRPGQTTHRPIQSFNNKRVASSHRPKPSSVIKQNMHGMVMVLDDSDDEDATASSSKSSPATAISESTTPYSKMDRPEAKRKASPSEGSSTFKKKAKTITESAIVLSDSD